MIVGPLVSEIEGCCYLDAFELTWDFGCTEVLDF